MFNDNETVREICEITGAHTEIKRAVRKTIALYVRGNGTLEIRCPKSLSAKAIIKLVQEKADWIAKKINKAEKYSGRHYIKQVHPGGSIPFLGKDCPVIETDIFAYGAKSNYGDMKFYVSKGLSREKFLEQIKEIYKKLFAEILNDHIKYFSNIMDLYPQNVRVGTARRSWGSCKGKNLTFTWRLAMADMDAVDYVIIHELAHIKHKNHGKLFWKEVEKYKPDYKECKYRLDELAHKIEAENL
ncbi:MAG: SprT family zinc-dependent metalloprotease [Bacillota bacterium]|nr:SprT family zinc-dependent metalloprotease [Bacillota bacterium]